MKLSGYLMRSTVVAALGGFLFGFDTAVISGTTGWLRQIFELSDISLGFTVATALIGTIVGSLAIGRPSDILGRRKALFILAALYFISAVGCAFSRSLVFIHDLSFHWRTWRRGRIGSVSDVHGRDFTCSFPWPTGRICTVQCHFRNINGLCFKLYNIFI